VQGRGIDRPTYERTQLVRGFSTWQTFGALVASGKLLSLSEVQMENAMELVGAQAPVPCVQKQFGDGGIHGWLKNGCGIAGKVGTLSAQLAAEGFEGHRNILDGANGWIISGPDQRRQELAWATLGRSAAHLSLQVLHHPNLLGNGLSSSPSNTSWPDTGYEDRTEAAHVALQRRDCRP